jgi:uncharacterized membrane protein YgdD (TMEM256/DUF423 family)
MPNTLLQKCVLAMAMGGFFSAHALKETRKHYEMKVSPAIMFVCASKAQLLSPSCSVGPSNFFSIGTFLFSLGHSLLAFEYTH